MSNVTSTVAASVIEKRVSPVIQETLIQNSVMIPAIWNRSAEVGPGMDRLDVPILGELAVQNVSETTELVPAAPVISVDQMALDQQKAILWAITDRTSVQSKIAISAEIFKNGGKTLAASIDDAIIAEMVAEVSAGAPDHVIAFDAGGVLGDADVRNARELMNIQNIPMSDRFLLVGPTAEKSLLGVANFIEVQKYGSEARALMTGELGRLYGFTVLMSTSSSLTAGEAMFFHRHCLTYATQINMRFDQDRNLKGHSDEFSLSLLYGVKGLDGGKRQVLVNAAGTP